MGTADGEVDQGPGSPLDQPFMVRAGLQVQSSSLAAVTTRTRSECCERKSTTQCYRSGLDADTMVAAWKRDGLPAWRE